MISEDLQVIISAKIGDFEKKMTTVTKKIDSVQKTGAEASKSIDKVLKSKSTGTAKSVDLVKQKLSQVNSRMDAVRKSFAKKIPMDASSIEVQKVKLDQLKQKYMDITAGNKAPTSLKAMEREFRTLEKQVTNVDGQLAKLYVDMQELETKKGLAKSLGDTRGVAEYQTQINLVKEQMNSLAASTDGAVARMTTLTARMEQVRLNPASSDEAQALAAKIGQADAKMQKLGNDSSKTGSKISSIKSGAKVLDNIDKKLKKIESSSSKTSKAVNRLAGMFLLMLARTLIRGAIQGLSESFEGAATKSDKLKSSLDSLTTAGRTISNAVVTALAPLINTAGPMIDSISAKIMELGNNIAMFFAAVTGQSTVMQATKTYQAYGTAATEAAGAAKAANSALAGFDQITKLDSNKSSGSGSGSSAADNGATSFTEVPVVGSDNAAKVKAAIDKIKGPLQDFYKNVLEPIGKWAMTDGLDLLVMGMTNISDFFAKNPQLIDNLALFLATILPLSALGPTAVVLGVTVQASVAAVEWITGKSVPDAIADSFNAELWKGAGGGSIARGVWNWIQDSMLHGTFQKEYFGTDSFAYQVIDAIEQALNIDSLGLVGFWEIGMNIGASITNGIISALNFASDLWLDPINKLLAKLGQEPIQFHIEPIDTHTFSASLQKSEEDTSKWATMTQKGHAQVAATTKKSYEETGKTVTTGTRDQSRTYQDYLYGLTTKTGKTYQTIQTTVDLGTKGAARYLTTNTASGVNTALGSYSGMPASVQGYLTTVADTVNSKAGVTARALYDQTKSGVNNTIPLFSSLVRESTIRMLRMAENSRLAVLNILKNLGYLPTTTDRASITAATTKVLGGSLASLPMYANGGVVNSATALIAGESGKEAVVPLERNTGWIDKLASKINSKGGSGDVYINSPVYLSNTGDFVGTIVKTIKRRDRQSNKPIFG